MITELTRAELIAAGERHRSDYLVEQAGYTLGVAAVDGQALSDLLPDQYLQEVTAMRDTVNRARQDKHLAAEESKGATLKQNLAVDNAKVWRRKVAKRAQRATRMGIAMPDGLIHISQSRTVPAIISQLGIMLKLLETNLAVMPGKGTEELLAEGRTILDALQGADSSQEVKRFKQLPTAVQDFYEQTGMCRSSLAHTE